jgi:hypothetical protein
MVYYPSVFLHTSLRSDYHPLALVDELGRAGGLTRSGGSAPFIYLGPPDILRRWVVREVTASRSNGRDFRRVTKILFWA